MKVVNFYGGPSAGKSTMAAQLFGWMKARRLNVEYAPEYAKELTWRGDGVTLDDQLRVFAEQHHRLYVLRDQVDWVTTDSPLLLSTYYMSLGCRKFSEHRYDQEWRLLFRDMVYTTYAMYDNVNFIVERGDRKFIQAGRNQDEAASRLIDGALEDMLSQGGFPHQRVNTLGHVVEALGLEEAFGGTGNQDQP